MRKHLRISLGLATLAVAALPFATAQAAHTNCHVTRFLAVGTQDATPNTTVYYEDRSENDPVPGGILGHSTWIYLESNGHAGLQHKAGQISIVDETDIEECTNYSQTWAPDTMII